MKKLLFLCLIIFAVFAQCVRPIEIIEVIDPNGSNTDTNGIEQNILIGAAITNITPPSGEGIGLSGFSSRWGKELSGIHDDIYAKVIIIKSNDEHFVEMSLDLLSFSSTRYKIIADRVANSPMAIPFENIFIAATHNHAGPSLHNEDPGTIEYEVNLMDSLYVAIERAYLNMESGYMKVGKVEAPFDIYHNRQYIDPVTGKCSIGRNVDGTSDKEIIVKEYFNSKNESIASSMVVSVHSTIMGEFNFYVSGDFAGYTTRYLESNLHPNHISLWMMGGGGDQSPRHYHQKTSAFQDDNKSPEALGEELGATIIANLDKAQVQTNINIESHPFKISLPYKNGGTEVRAGYVTALNKETAIVSTPYELFSATVIEIKSKSPFENTLIYSNCNGVNAYIPTPDSYGFKCYENRRADFLEEDAERYLVSATLEALNEMYAEY